MVLLSPIKDQEVTVAQTGTGKISKTNNSTFPSSPTELDITVPVGKKWLIHGLSFRTTGGTTDRGIVGIRSGSDQFPIYDKSESQASYINKGVNDIPQMELTAGMIIRYSSYYSAGPTTQTLYVAYTEIDA